MIDLLRQGRENLRPVSHNDHVLDSNPKFLGYVDPRFYGKTEFLGITSPLSGEM